MRRTTGNESDQSQVYPNQLEREEALEWKWTYPEKRAGASTLSFVAANADSLFDEFISWLDGGGQAADRMSTWERERFGNELEPAARGMLMARLRGKERMTSRLSLEQAEAWVRKNQRKQGEGALTYVARIARGSGLLESINAPLVRSFPDLTPEEQSTIARGRNEPREPGSDG